MCEMCFEGLGISSLKLPGGREDRGRNEWQEGERKVQRK